MTKTHSRFLDKSTPPHIATLVIMSGLSAMAMNLFLPALPAMASHFETDYGVMQLSVAVYLGVSAALQLVIGPLSDRFGRRPVVLGGITIFIFASVAAIYAPSIGAFLALRAVQTGVVTCMVLSRAVVRDMVPGPAAASMIAYVTMGMSLVPMFAPFIGGVLTTAFGWEANFWLLAIGGCVVLTLTYLDQGETRPDNAATDLRGMLMAFPTLLSSQRFLGYAFCAATSSGAFFAYMGGAPFVGTSIFNLSESTLGIYMSTPAIGYFFGNFASGRYAVRLGPNKMVLYGAILLVLTQIGALLIFSLGFGSATTFFGAMILLGFSNGLQIPNAMAGTLSVRPDLAGTASGLGGTIMIGGGAALSALAGALLTTETGAMPLLWLMLYAAIGSLVGILWVLHRERRLGRF